MPEHNFHTPGPVRLDVKIAAGDIAVSTVDGEESTVSIEGSGNLADAVHVELTSERLVIQQRRKSWLGLFDRPEHRLHAQVRVPHGSSVEIVTASADATLDGRFNALEVKSASGQVLATGEFAGNAIVESVSGEVRLPRVAGDLTVRTVSGDVEAQAVEGSVSTRTVSGDLRISSLHRGNVNVQSVSGDVALGIASGTNIDLDARSASGNLDSEILLSDTPTGEGGPIVVIRGNTVSGDIQVFRAAEPSPVGARL